MTDPTTLSGILRITIENITGANYVQLNPQNPAGGIDNNYTAEVLPYYKLYAHNSQVAGGLASSGDPRLTFCSGVGFRYADGYAKGTNPGDGNLDVLLTFWNGLSMRANVEPQSNDSGLISVIGGWPSDWQLEGIAAYFGLF